MEKTYRALVLYSFYQFAKLLIQIPHGFVLKKELLDLGAKMKRRYQF
jgi:hypothetical protein